MNAVIYCRVSTAEQTKNLRLSTQKIACETYCAREGYRVAKIDFLVVYNLSRFARNNADHVHLRMRLNKAGVQLRSVTEQIDETALGQLMENILSAFAQFENNQKAERSKAGMTAALEQGRWTHQAPLGYRTGDKDGPSLLPDNERAELICMAFDLVADGAKPKEALRRVVGLGLRTRKGRELALQSFHSLLRNPLYAGRIESAWGIRVQGDFEALVSEEMFDRVQQLLRGNGGRSGRHKARNPDFPLRRFVRCGACTHLLTGSTSRGRSHPYSYYHCHRCRSARVSRPHLESEFLLLLKRLRPAQGCLRLFEAIRA